MLEIVTAISEMVGSQANADTPEKRVEHIFAVMDEVSWYIVLDSEKRRNLYNPMW